MRSGVPHRGGLPGQPDRVTRLAGVSFLHVKAEGGVTRLAGVMFIRALVFNSEFRQSPPKEHGCQPLQAWGAYPLISSSKYLKTKTVLVKKTLKKLTVPSTI